MGYPVENTRNAFEIQGVPKRVIDCFSKRHIEIDEKEKEFGRVGDPAFRKQIAQIYRAPKGTYTSVEDLRAGWLNELSAEDRNVLQEIRERAVRPCKLEKIPVEKALNLAVTHCFERESVVNQSQLIAEALDIGNGSLAVAEIRDAILKHKEIVKFGNLVTISERVNDETFCVLWVNDGVGKFPPLAEAKDIDQGLSTEHREAVHAILVSEDRVVELTGPPGAGKTTVLFQIYKSAYLSGKTFHACAPTHKAVQVLKRNGFPSTSTLEKLLTDGRRQQICLQNAVILLDEAGLVSCRKMRELFELAERWNCRLLLSGDSAQHKSVEAGDALRILEKESRLQQIHLKTIYRQTDAMSSGSNSAS